MSGDKFDKLPLFFYSLEGAWFRLQNILEVGLENPRFTNICPGNNWNNKLIFAPAYMRKCIRTQETRHYLHSSQVTSSSPSHLIFISKWDHRILMYCLLMQADADDVYMVYILLGGKIKLIWERVILMGFV